MKKRGLRLASVAVALAISSTGALTILNSVSAASPISIGVLGPMTGPYAQVGEGFLYGARAAQKEINDDGGILGHQLQIAYGDDANDPADAVPALRQMIAQNHIIALDGPESAVLPAVTPIIDENKLPTMFQGGTVTFDTNTDKWLWRPSPSDAQLGVAMAAYALQKHYKTAVLLFESIASVQTLGGVVANAYKENGGKVLANITITGDQSSYLSVVERIAALHPQVIFTQVDSTTAGPVFSEFDQVNGLKTPFIGSDLTAAGDVISVLTPKVAHKSLTSIESAVGTGPAVSTFNHYYHELYHGQPLGGANYSYDAILELALAMEKAGTLNPTKVDAAIPTVSNPPGTDVTNFKTGEADIKAGKKIHLVGSGGPAGYDKYHNSFGSFAAVRANAKSGVLETAAEVSVATIKLVEEGKLHP